MATAAMAANEVLARVRGRGYPLSGTRGTWVARFVAAFVIPHPAFAICHPSSVISPSAFRIPHFLERKGGHSLSVSGTLETWLAPVDSAMRATLHLPVTRRIKVVRTTEWGDPRRTRQLAACGCTGRRPPATLPSRSAIARPRLAPRLPLGTLALFPPLLSRYPLTRQSNILGKWGL